MRLTAPLLLSAIATTQVLADIQGSSSIRPSDNAIGRRSIPYQPQPDQAGQFLPAMKRQQPPSQRRSPSRSHKVTRRSPHPEPDADATLAQARAMRYGLARRDAAPAALPAAMRPEAGTAHTRRNKGVGSFYDAPERTPKPEKRFVAELGHRVTRAYAKAGQRVAAKFTRREAEASNAITKASDARQSVAPEVNAEASKVISKSSSSSSSGGSSKMVEVEKRNAEASGAITGAGDGGSRRVEMARRDARSNAITKSSGSGSRRIEPQKRSDAINKIGGDGQAQG